MLDKKNKSSLQTHLIIGSPKASLLYAQNFIQRCYCLHDSCGVCAQCMQIKNYNFHSMLWIRPEKSYTREILEPVFHRISFARTDENPFFIILESMDLLTPAVGNSLLKSIEEPPAGYIFLLLCTTKENVMKTVISRCVIHQLTQDQQEASISTDFIEILSQYQTASFADFQKEFSLAVQHENDARKIVDLLYRKWSNELQVAIQEGDQKEIVRTQKNCFLIQESMKQLPMPGSTKIFFRNLLMQLKVS